MAILRSCKLPCHTGLRPCGTQQQVIPRLLTHSAILRITCGSVDGTPNRRLHWALGVCPLRTYASVSVRSELDLLQLDLLARKRALRHLGRFLRNHIPFTEQIRPLCGDAFANNQGELWAPL
jgi:hypothetical protein